MDFKCMRREVLTVQSVLRVFAFGDAAWSKDPEAGPGGTDKGLPRSLRYTCCAFKPGSSTFQEVWPCTCKSLW